MPRRNLDAYYSASWMVDRLLENISISGTVFEPCVGTGAISNPLKARGLEVVTNDVDPQVEANFYFDYLKHPFVGCVDWIITNPPFSCALDMLIKARREARLGVAFHLRLSFLEPTKDRVAFLNANPPDALIVLPRFSFTGDGKSDTVTTAWMVWKSESLKTARQVIAVSRRIE